MTRTGGIFFALAAGTVSGGLSWSQERVALRVDDVGDETRLEIPFGSVTFAVEQPTSRVIDILTADPSLLFDLSQVTSRQNASRIANARIVADGDMNRLRVVMNCECTSRFRVDDGTLAVTIVADAGELDLSAIENTPASVSAASGAPKKAPEPTRRPIEMAGINSSLSARLERDTGSEGGLQSLEARSGDDQRAPIIAPAPTRRPGESAQIRPVGSNESDQGAQITDVVLAREHLLKQLARAAEQGLVEFVSDEAAALAPDTQAETQSLVEAETDEAADASESEREDIIGEEDVETGQSVAESAPSPPSPPVELPLRARTAVDKSFRADRADTRVEIASCIEGGRLDLASWASGGTFVEVESALRAAALDEEDSPVADIVTALTRHYVVYGFGAEAEQLLRLYSAAIADAELLRSLAEVMDGNSPSTDSPLARSAPCSPEAALWRTIARLPNNIATGEPWLDGPPNGVTSSALIEAFARLPAATRRVIGPQLLERLADLGEVETANQLELVLGRNPATNVPELNFGRARLLEASGKMGAAEALYQEIASSDGPHADAALIQLLESRISRGEGSEELTDALAEAAFVARGTSMEARLKVAEIRSRAITDGPSATLNTLKEQFARSDGQPTWLRDAGHAALEVMTAQSPGEYAEAVLDYAPFVGNDASADPARRKVAAELLNIGLANSALDYLAPARLRSAPETRRLAAKAMIAVGLTSEALAEVKGLEDDEADLIRIEAFEKLSRFEEASQLAADLPGQSEEDRAARALRAGNWTEASIAGDPSRRSLAAFMAQQAVNGSDGEPSAQSSLDTSRSAPGEASLDSLRDAVDESQAARTLVTEALGDG